MWWFWDSLWWWKKLKPYTPLFGWTENNWNLNIYIEKPWKNINTKIKTLLNETKKEIWIEQQKLDKIFNNLLKEFYKFNDLNNLVHLNWLENEIDIKSSKNQIRTAFPSYDYYSKDPNVSVKATEWLWIIKSNIKDKTILTIGLLKLIATDKQIFWGSISDVEGSILTIRIEKKNNIYTTFVNNHNLKNDNNTFFTKDFDYITSGNDFSNFKKINFKEFKNKYSNLIKNNIDKTKEYIIKYVKNIRKKKASNY